MSELEGKNIEEVIAAGVSKLASVPSGGGGGGGAAAAGGGGAAAAGKLGVACCAYGSLPGQFCGNDKVLGTQDHCKVCMFSQEHVYQVAVCKLYETTLVTMSHRLSSP